MCATEPPGSLEEFSRISLQMMREAIPDLQVDGDLREFSLCGQPAVSAEYSTNSSPAGPLKFFQAWTLHENIAHIITFSVLVREFERYKATVMKCVNTMRIDGDALLVTLEANALTPDENLMLEAYVDEALGFSMLYPKVWSMKRDDPECPVQFALDMKVGDRTVHLSVMPHAVAVPQSLTLAQYEEIFLNQLRKQIADDDDEEFPRELEKIELNGVPARYCQFALPEEDESTAIAFALFNGLAYTLTFSYSEFAAPKMRDITNRLIAHFRFTRNSIHYSPRYENLMHKVTFPMPSGFDLAEAQLGTAAFVRTGEQSPFPTNFTFVVRDVNEGISLEQFAALLRSQLEMSIPMFFPNVSSCLMLGRKACEFTYQAQAGNGVTVRFRQRFTVRGKVAYMMSLISNVIVFDQEWQQFARTFEGCDFYA
jgi:hypothetical protein